MKYRAEVKFNDKTAKQTYNSETMKQRLVNENGFVSYIEGTDETRYLDMVRRFEAKAQTEGYYFKVDRFVDGKWLTYTEVEV